MSEGIAEIKREYINKLLQMGRRVDGREANEYREIQIDRKSVV